MAIWLRFKSYIIASVAGIAAILGVYFAGRKDGYRSAENTAREADLKESRRVEDAADKARNVAGDPIDRLRRHNKLRD